MRGRTQEKRGPDHKRHAEGVFAMPRRPAAFVPVEGFQGTEG